MCVMKSSLQENHVIDNLFPQGQECRGHIRLLNSNVGSGPGYTPWTNHFSLRQSSLKMILHKMVHKTCLKTVVHKIKGFSNVTSN
jgi:hypothetical protein